jgi:hypothetical protein
VVVRLAMVSVRVTAGVAPLSVGVGTELLMAEIFGENERKTGFKNKSRGVVNVGDNVRREEMMRLIIYW